MKAYRTFVTLDDPGRVVLTDLPFEAGERVEVVVLAPELDRDARSQLLRDLLQRTQSLSQSQRISEDEIALEVEAHRSGQ